MKRLFILIIYLFMTAYSYAGVSVKITTTDAIYQTSHALVIGIDDYSRWSELPGVQGDVNAITSSLTSIGFQVTQLINPDKKRFKEALNSFMEKATLENNNRSIIYFAGHGWTDNDEGYIVMQDSPLPFEGKQQFAEHSVSMDELNEIIGAYDNAHHLLIALDSCFSGSVFDAMTKRSPALSSDLKESFVRSSRLIIASGTAEQEVPDESIFRKMFISAIYGAADFTSDGFVSGTELSLFIRSKVAAASNGGQTPQYANISSNVNQELPGEMVFYPSGKVLEDLKLAPVNANLQRSGVSLFDCEDECPELIAVPKGKLSITSNEHANTLNFEHRFAISAFEIKFREWDSCFRDGWCSKWIPRDQNHSIHHPVFGVSYNDATQFVEWLRMKTSDNSYRLPSYEEWLYAARAGMVTKFHWGDELSPNHIACHYCGNSYPDTVMLPSGSFQANSFGVYDAVGSLWEWVDYCNAESLCALAGSSWVTSPKDMHLDAIGFYPKSQSMPNFGFRVARDIK